MHLRAKDESRKVPDSSSPVSCFMGESHSKHQAVVLTNTSRIGEAAHSTRSCETCSNFSINIVFLNIVISFFTNTEFRLVILESCSAD